MIHPKPAAKCRGSVPIKDMDERLYKKLKQADGKGLLEVEHLLALVHASEKRATAETLDKLCAELNWFRIEDQTEENMVVPLATWTLAITTWLRTGIAGLLKMVRHDRDLLRFALPVFQELGTKEAVDGIWKLIEQEKIEPRRDMEDAMRCASALNLILSFKPVPLTARMEKRIREYLHDMLNGAESTLERATAILALRGVGDESSIALIKENMPLDAPWSDSPPHAIRKIRKRLKAKATG